SATDYRTGIYTQAWTERTYSELVSRTAVLLTMGESVILDATWTSAEHRQVAAAVADKAAAEFVQLRCALPPQMVAGRITSRADVVSDATPEIAARLAAEQAPWPEAVVIDTSGGSGIAGNDTVRLALDTIRPHGPEHVWRPVRPYMEPD